MHNAAYNRVKYYAPFKGYQDERNASRPCTNLTEGHFAEEYIQQLALHLGDFSKGVAAVEQIKAETEPNEGQYYTHIGAATFLKHYMASGIAASLTASQT